MASRRLNSQDRSHSQTKTNPREPRDECMRLPKTTLSEQRALRPKPLNLPIKPSTSPPIPKAPPPSRTESLSFESPRDPEIVDSAWPRGDAPKVLPNGRMHSPSIVSQQSGRQSEISLGILDYYLRDTSPSIVSPELPSTPKFDQSADRFDFGVPNTPTPLQTNNGIHASTKAGAERKQLPPLPTTVPHTPKDPNPSNKAYRLFPVVQQVTPPARYPAITIIDPVPFRDFPPTTTTTTSTKPSSTTTPFHTQPDASYRPRKESISSSACSRADSTNSFSFRRDRKDSLIPLRILSGSTTTTTSISNGRTTSTSTTLAGISSSSPSEAAAAEPYSRWSDETITSPLSSSSSMTQTPGTTRTSFGSLLLTRQQRQQQQQQNETQYPDCFFEDDEEEDAPLRRKFAWKKKSMGGCSLEGSRRRRRSLGRFDEVERNWGWRVIGVMFCGCVGR